ncbi:PTPA-domain-containing protein [Meredithblackwellia eburnea MCA 4105]
MTSTTDQLPPIPLHTVAANSEPSSSTTTSEYAPKRKIFTEMDMQYWQKSDAHYLVQLTIARLAKAVEGRGVADECFESPIIQKIVTFLNELEGKVEGVELDKGPQRFGNKAFRTWVSDIMALSEGPFHTTLLPPAMHPVLPELSHAFQSSFGSPLRLDYGTGHELSFLTYLAILLSLGVCTDRDEQALVTRVFVAYIDCVRALQKKFRLEPAGSKGVWGLDDHQHLAYLFGAAQLHSDPSTPSSILKSSRSPSTPPNNLFTSSLTHLHTLKTGPFHEHSPLLHQIGSTVPSWTKVSQGLTKMYEHEVLQKRVVVQHLVFGGVLRWVEEGAAAVGAPSLPSSGDGKEDDHQTDHSTISTSAASEPASALGDETTFAPWTLPGGTPLVVDSAHLAPRRDSTPPGLRTAPLSPTLPSTSVLSPPAAGVPVVEPKRFEPPAFFPVPSNGDLPGSSSSSPHRMARKLSGLHTRPVISSHDHEEEAVL